MKERLAFYREKVQAFWQQRPPRHKWLIGLSALTFLLALGLYIFIASQPVYVPLYNKRLSEQEIGLIKEQLDAQNIPYRIVNNGTGIEVPQARAQEVIVDLAAQGIPREAGISTEIFSETGMFGMTDRQIDMLQKDALQIEIKRLLERVKGVENAQVILTLPEESIWVTEKPDQATASVIVEVQPGFQLSQEQIRAMYYLVSRSVTNLPIENITITDQYSNLLELNDEGQNGPSLATYQQQEKIKAEVERKIQQNLYNLLGTIMGRDKVIVHAAVKMNFSQENRVENLVEPVDKENNEGIIISAEKLSKTFSGEGAPPAGIVGTGENDVPGYPATSQQGSSSEYEELVDRVNREVNRITRNVIESPYKVEDISINVGVEPPDGEELDQQTIENIRQILRNVVLVTIGDRNGELTDEDLNKRIFVFPRTFSGKVAAQEEPLLTPAVLWGAAVLALAALGGVGYVLYRRRQQRQEEEAMPDLSSPQPTEVPDLMYQEDSSEVIVRKQLEKLAKSKPDEFVMLLRTWLAED